MQKTKNSIRYSPFNVGGHDQHNWETDKHPWLVLEFRLGLKEI